MDNEDMSEIADVPDEVNDALQVAAQYLMGRGPAPDIDALAPDLRDMVDELLPAIVELVGDRIAPAGDTRVPIGGRRLRALRVIIGLDPEDEQLDIWTTDLDYFEPGEGRFDLTVPSDLVDELERAWAIVRDAQDAIVRHTGFDPGSGRLPLCDGYDGQRHEFSNGYVGWDDCWRCGHPFEAHDG